jgi:FRG domain.
MSKDHLTKIFWFRGMDNATYELSPKLFRQDLGDRTPYDTQQLLYDQYIARSNASLELNHHYMSGDIDWISSMQHYEVPTNLLDFSENLTTAMYFMLEPLIKASLDQKNAKTGEPINKDIKEKSDTSRKNGVAIYMFDPIAYNAAWQSYVPKSPCSLLNEKYCEINNSAVPNLSSAHSAEQFSAYILGDNDFKKRCASRSSECKNCALQMPLAIMTGQSNMRLIQQSGTFLAFSLHSHSKWDDENSAASTLDAVHRKMLTDYENSPSDAKVGLKRPALYKIVLKGDALDELTEWLQMIGMRTYKIYPELSYIGMFVKQSNGG